MVVSGFPCVGMNGSCLWQTSLVTLDVAIDVDSQFSFVTLNCSDTIAQVWTHCIVGELTAEASGGRWDECPEELLKKISECATLTLRDLGILAPLCKAFAETSSERCTAERTWLAEVAQSLEPENKAFQFLLTLPPGRGWNLTDELGQTDWPILRARQRSVLLAHVAKCNARPKYAAEIDSCGRGRPWAPTRFTGALESPVLHKPPERLVHLEDLRGNKALYIASHFEVCGRFSAEVYTDDLARAVVYLALLHEACKAVAEAHGGGWSGESPPPTLTLRYESETTPRQLTWSEIESFPEDTRRALVALKMSHCRSQKEFPILSLSLIRRFTSRKARLCPSRSC
jgi:hypothetical protein